MGLTAADYRNQLLNLLPRGRAWARDITSTMAAFMHAIGDEFALLHERARVLIEEESNPLSAVETIDDWEKSLGLPDACSSAAPTLAERQAAAAGRYYGNGGHSIPYLIDVALQMGFVITIVDKVTPHHYEVKVPGVEAVRLSVGEGPGHTVGEPLRTYGDEIALECVLMRLHQSHTVATFTYGGTESYSVTYTYQEQNRA